MTNEHIQQRIQERFGTAVTGFEQPYEMLTFEIAAEKNIELLQYLFDEQDLHFQFLTDLSVVHYPENEGRELAVVYHLHNLIDNFRIRFKCFLAVRQPEIASATAVFESANWQERESYDFYGVDFLGHPNLKRILNVEEMDYFPMRKEFPLEDQSRSDKDDEMFGRGGSVS